MKHYKKTVVIQVLVELSCDHFVQYFGHKRKIGDGSLVEQDCLD